MFSILYVDDERDLLELAKLFLEQSPEFHIEIALSAREALASQHILSCDAIISDYQMPEMDGIAFLKTVRERFGNIPFILFTGRGREEIVIEAINNGVDFYLQKGGDVRSQFAELAHKIRQVVARRQAERSLIESEKRLADIINFLPDATLAINREGVIIAWNRAIEEMTGISAEMMLGKGNYEYALPFYGERRPILIDLIFEPDEVIKQKYSHIVRKKDVLLADTTLPRLQGREVALFGKASPLYNSKGEIVGAIEAIRDISERQKADDELRLAYEHITASEEELRGQLEMLAESEQRAKENESKYRDLFDNSVTGIFRTTLEGKFLAINTTFARIAGYGTPQEMMEAIEDTRTQLYLNPEDRDLFMSTLKTEGMVRDFHARFFNRQGHTLWIKINAVAIQGADGNVQYYEGTIEDITDRKLAEDALRESEEKYRTILENIQDVYYRSDAEDNLIMASPSLVSLLGYDSPDEIMGKNIVRDLWQYPDQRQAFLERIRMNGSVNSYEVVFKRKDGTPVTVATSSHFYYAKDGSFAGIEGIFRDITALKEANQQIELLAGLIEITPAAVIVHDTEGKIIYANQGAFSLHGYTREEFLAKNLHQLVVPESELLIAQRIGQILTTGHAAFDVEHFRKDGSRIPLHVTTKAARWKDQQIIISVAIDLSDRMEAEKIQFENEERLQLALAGADLGTWNWNVETGEVVFNERWAEMLGYRLDEIEPNVKSWEKLIHPDDIQRIQELLTAHLEGRAESYECEHRLLHKNGSWIWVLDKGRVIQRDNEGRPQLAAGTHLDITQRKLVDEEHRQNEARLRLITENMVDQISQIDADHIIRYVSPSVERMMGYKPEDLIGTLATDYLHPDDIDEVIQVARAATKAHLQSVRLEFRYRHKNGDYRWFESETRIIYDETGEYSGMIFTSRDITKRKQVEKELAESEAKYRRITDNARDMVYRMAIPSGQYEYVSTASVAMIGYTPEELYADSGIARNSIHPDWKEYFTQQWSEMLEGRVPPEYEYQIIDRAGKMHWFNQRNVLVKGENGKPVALEGIVTDITDRKQVEAALRESEQRYRSVIENIQDAVVQSDREGRLVMASPSAARLIGYESPDEILGMPMTSFYKNPDDRQAMLNEMTRTGKLVDYIFEIKRRDGSTLWGSLNAHFLYDKTGQIKGTEGAIHDITERRLMEQAIREANHKLNLLNSITRHDVANQLTILQGFAQIAAMKKGDPVITDYLTKILASADTIARQIEFTRTYQELGVRAPLWVLIEGVIGHVESRVPVRFSKTCGGIEIYTDPMLERVFFNLVDNAIRHGGRVTEITVRCEREPDSLLVIVEDNGIGIPLAEKEKIFKRGYGKNSGLGLFLVQEILAITGITIRETGIPGTGARFEMRVPTGSYRLVKP